MSKYTEEEVQDACLAWADYKIQVSRIKDLVALPFDKWWAVYNKPAKKTIDLAPLIASGIDCMFSDDGVRRQIGNLFCIRNSSHNKRQFYEDDLESNWGQCCPRMYHKMLHSGGECPLPEGFKVTLYYRNAGVSRGSNYIDLRWDNTGLEEDIIGYEILGLADGYAYPWEQTE